MEWSLVTVKVNKDTLRVCRGVKVSRAGTQLATLTGSYGKFFTRRVHYLHPTGRVPTLIGRTKFRYFPDFLRSTVTIFQAIFGK